MVNNWGNYDMPTEKIFKLGPLECAASSFVNALILWGKNPNLLLVNYWNLGYYKKLLVGSKDLNSCFVPFLYGFEIQTQKGKIQDIIDLLDRNNMAIVHCQGSQLAYFPTQYSRHENLGLGHTFLLYGYNPNDRSYMIVDPMAEYSGCIPEAQMNAVEDPDGYLSYFPLIYNDFEGPKIEDAFIRATVNNYLLYTQKVYSYGHNSLDLFFNDIMDSLNWDSTNRGEWLDLNCLTISSLIYNRTIVWNSFKEIKLLNSEEEQSLEGKMDALIKQWKLLIFLLLKCKKAISANICENIRGKLDLLNRNEAEILSVFFEAGQRVNKEKRR